MVTGCWARLLQSFASGIQATTASFCHFFLKLLVFAAERKGCLYACGDRWPKRRGRDSGEESTQKQNDLVGWNNWPTLLSLLQGPERGGTEFTQV